MPICHWITRKQSSKQLFRMIWTKFNAGTYNCWLLALWHVSTYNVLSLLLDYLTCFYWCVFCVYYECFCSFKNNRHTYISLPSTKTEYFHSWGFFKYFSNLKAIRKKSSMSKILFFKNLGAVHKSVRNQ